MSLTASSPSSSKISVASRIDKLRLDVAEKQRPKPFGTSVFFVFGLVADITPQVEHTSAKTPLGEQGDAKEEGIDLLVMPDD